MQRASTRRRDSDKELKEDMMKNIFKLSGQVTVATLLMAILALPTVGNAQTQAASNASLQDTLNWLTTFLPNATGANTGAGSTQSGSIDSVNGCNITILQQGVYPNQAPSTGTYSFSLSDIDPTKISSSGTGAGTFAVVLNTRGGAKSVKLVGNPILGSHTSFVVLQAFADQASAQRVVNAFQHAAQLCANAQPF